MKTNTLWTIIVALIVINCMTVAFFVTSKNSASKVSNNDEIVATIGEETITQQEWLHALEERFGKQLLEDMIDEAVVLQMADKYKITIPKDVIDREVTMIKTMYSPTDINLGDEKNWREQIELSLLLEELLTKDVKISEEELQSYYQENKHLYSIPKSYHLSHIVVSTIEEAKQVLEEVENGSNFNTLAMERSIDEFTSMRGGDLGFVSTTSDFVPQAYLEAANEIEINKWSNPIQVNDGYAIIMLHETIEEVTYTYDQVKDQIRRLIAIEQMNGSLSVQPFWEEANVSWFYKK